MFVRLVSFFLTSCLMIASASAGVVTYTLTGGNMNGTLNGISFSGKSYSITAQVDPSSFSSGSVGGFLPIIYASAVSTMTIDGIAPFQITTANFGPYVADYTALSAGLYIAGFAFVDFVNVGLTGFHTLGAKTGDPVNGPGTVSGDSFFSDSVPYTTTAGDLIIDSFLAIPALYTANATSSVPEPSSMAIFGLSALGVAYRRRRKLLK
jgi:hypothetical protein